MTLGLSGYLNTPLTQRGPEMNIYKVKTSWRADMSSSTEPGSKKKCHSLGCQDNRHMPTHLVYVALDMKPRASWVLSKLSTHWATLGHLGCFTKINMELDSEWKNIKIWFAKLSWLNLVGSLTLSEINRGILIGSFEVGSRHKSGSHLLVAAHVKITWKRTFAFCLRVHLPCCWVIPSLGSVPTSLGFQCRLKTGSSLGTPWDSSTRLGPPRHPPPGLSIPVQRQPTSYSNKSKI